MDVSARLPRLYSEGSTRFELVLRYEDIRWLTGFTGGTSQLLVDRGSREAYLIVDGRYVDRAHDELAASKASVTVVQMSGMRQAHDCVADIVRTDSIAVDPAHLTVAHMNVLRQNMTVFEASTSMDVLRRIKDDNEIELIHRAANIAHDALMSVISDGIIGKTERQIRNRIDQCMRDGGADDVGFDTIVATGANAARPHHEPTNDVIEVGHMVVIDFGAEVDGYRSDMTRTIRVGPQSAAMESMFALVFEAQAAGVAAVTSGVVGSEIDSAVRRVFAAAGVEHEYVHGTGHGIGLYIHEQPIFSPRCEAVLGVNEVVTVEPGLYRKGVGGVRIEDLVVVTDNRCRILTNTPKDLSCPRSPQTI